MTERQETLTQYVGDMLSLTRHIHQAVERQLDDQRLKSDREASALVTRIDQTLEMHISRLEQHMKSLGGDATSPIKEAVSSIAGIAAGLYDKVRTDPVSKMLRDDYTALSLASIAQTMLHTTGLALKHQPTADLALQALKDITPLVVDISQIIPRLTVNELTDAGEVVDTSVYQQAINNTQFAWSNQVTGK